MNELIYPLLIAKNNEDKLKDKNQGNRIALESALYPSIGKGGVGSMLIAQKWIDLQSEKEALQDKVDKLEKVNRKLGQFEEGIHKMVEMNVGPPEFKIILEKLEKAIVEIKNQNTEDISLDSVAAISEIQDRIEEKVDLQRDLDFSTQGIKKIDDYLDGLDKPELHAITAPSTSPAILYDLHPDGILKLLGEASITSGPIFDLFKNATTP